MLSEKHKRVVMILISDFVYPYLDPRVYKEAQSLVKNGYDVSVVCWGSRRHNVPEYERYEEIDVFRIFQAIPAYTTPLIMRLPAYVRFALKSVKRSLQLKPDIIHCHDLDTLVIGVILKLIAKKPLIFDAHEDFPAMYRSMGGSVWLSSLMRFYEKWLIRFSDEVIAAEQLYVDNMRKHYRVDPTVILNFPNLEHFNPSVDPSPIIDKYRLSGKVVISHIGGIGRNRALYEEIEALSYLTSDNFIFLLVGKATKKTQAEIKEAVRRFKVEDRVILLLDGVRHEDIPKYFRASDITMALLYPTPSYVTSVPTKLYESLAMGVPAITTDLPHIRKIVDTYEVGLCANSQNPGDIAEKLNILISDRQLRERLGQNGLKIANEEFTWSRSQERLLETYDTLLSGE